LRYLSIKDGTFHKELDLNMYKAWKREKNETTTLYEQ